MPDLPFLIQPDDFRQVLIDIRRKMQPVDIHIFPSKLQEILLKRFPDLPRTVFPQRGKFGRQHDVLRAEFADHFLRLAKSIVLSQVKYQKTVFFCGLDACLQRFAIYGTPPDQFSICCTAP